MKIKRKLEKCLVLLLVLSILTGTAGRSCIQAKEEEKKSWKGDGFEVVYTIDNSWDGGYNATVEIQNTGQRKIENWCITFCHPEKITNIWNARITDAENGYYTVKNAGWNQDIPQGKSVCFGMTVAGKQKALPEEYLLNGTVKESDKKNYTVDFHKTDSWSTPTGEREYTGTVEITNLSESAVEEWELCFFMKDKITRIWNGEITGSQNGNYQIKGCDYNQNIAPGQSVTFGFTGQEEQESVPETFSLREFVTQEKGQSGNGTGEEEALSPAPDTTPKPTSTPTTPPAEEETEENELNEKTVCDYVNIDLKTGNTYQSVLDDVRFLNTAPDELHVTWHISHPDILSPDGTVTRPEKDTPVKITADILFEGKEYHKDFKLNVMAQNSIRKEDIEDLSVADLNQMNKEDEDYEVEINDYGYLENVMGQFSDVKVTSYESALYSLYSVKSAMGITDPFSELKPYDTKTDESGCIFKFTQTYKGIPVFGSRVVVSSDTEGRTDFFLSDYFPVDEKVELEPKLSYEEAAQKAKDKYPGIRIISEIPAYYILNYYGQCDLVWEICFSMDSEQNGLEVGEYRALIDATDGEVKYLANGSCNANTRICTTGTDLLGNLKAIWIKKRTSFFSEPKYRLEDTKRNITIFDAHQGTIENRTKIEKDKKNAWTPTEVSAMANMAAAYEYYRREHSRFSYDDALFQMTGNDIDVYINYDKRNNAEWDMLNKCIKIGTGDGKKYPLRSFGAGLDVLAHEFTHAITMYETTLTYAYCGATGAIDEAYSDIMAAYVDGNWQCGEDVTFHRDHPMRDMSNPLKRENPDTFGGYKFVDYRVVPFDDEDNHDYGGVHTNSTILSHIAYQMQNEEFTDRRVDKLWYKSLCMGYRWKTDFYDVRKQVIKAAKKLKYSKEDIKTIKRLFTKAGITKENCDEDATYFKKVAKHLGYSAAYADSEKSIHGTVAEADSDTDNKNNTALEDVDVTLMNQSQTEVLEETVTDEDGEYEFSMNGGEEVRCAAFRLDGYLDETMYIDGIKDPLQKESQCDMVEMIPASRNGSGTASGIIRDAVTGEGVRQAKLLIRKGINNHYTEIMDTVTTESDGSYQTHELPAGNYCVEIQGTNGLTTCFNIKILGEECIANQNGILSPPMEDDQMRVVLSWKGSPVDLDLHMMFRLSNGKKKHLYFGQKRYYINNQPGFILDCDSTEGYGPETITLYQPKTGEYVFYVNNFEEEAEMGGCGAKVQIYYGNQTTPSRTFYVPNTEGTSWEVFHYNSATSRIQAVNRMMDREPRMTDYWWR